MKEKLVSVTMDDCEMQTFTCGGKGGSGKDTSNNGVRIIHRPSGAVGEGREQRHQAANKKQAFMRMARSDKMQVWLRMESSKKLGKKTPEQLAEEVVEKLMLPHNLKVEYQEDAGEWRAEIVSTN